MIKVTHSMKSAEISCIEKMVGVGISSWSRAIDVSHSSRQRTHGSRGVAYKDAIKGTKKSVAIISSSGDVVTVIPDTWKAADEMKKMAEQQM